MNIIITEVNGWSKTLEVKKAITRIGNAPSVDVQIPSNSIAPLHLQILSNPELPTGCRVVNLSSQLEFIHHGNLTPLEPYSTQDINDGDEIRLGEYRLTFQVPFSTAFLRTCKSIEATLNLTDTTLQPHLALDGVLTVKNVGEQDACQFQVSLSGLPEDCFHIDPIPLLYPGAQEDVHVRFFHQITYPQAGRRDLLITINAPDDYPGEELVIRQSLFIAPVFKQALELLDDIALSPAPTTPIMNNKPGAPEMTNLQAEPEEQLQPAVEPEMEADPRQAPEEVQQIPVLELAEDHIFETQQELTPLEAQTTPSVEKRDEPALGNRQQPASEDGQQPPAIKIAVEPELENQPELAPVEAQQPPVFETTVEPVLESQPEPPMAKELHSAPAGNAAEVAPGAPEQQAAASSEPVKPSTHPVPVLTVKHDALNELWPDETPHETTPSPDDVQDLDLSRVKVVHHQTENYWDEN